MTERNERICLRTIGFTDLPEALDLSTLANWNQTTEDWAMLLDLAPQTCFMIEADGRLAATCTLVCYGIQLAWLGMVLTRPEYRGRGFARSLIERALAVADDLGIRSVMLDATDQGSPLYRKLNFRDQQTIERWVRNRQPVEQQKLARAEVSAEKIRALDRQVHHAERSDLLSSLIEHGEVFCAPDGFLLSRPGRHMSFLGPCAAASEKEATEMIKQCLNSRPSAWCWDLLPANEYAAGIAKQFGFERARRLTRMVRGIEIRCEASKLWATAGFEVG